MMVDLPGERWRAVTGFEDIYQVSDHGRVKSLARTVSAGRQSRHLPEQLRKTSLRRGGLYIVLWTEGASSQLRVGRLVAEAFLGECPPGHQVMLIDGDPANAALSNLVYATRPTIELAKIERGTAPTGQEAHRAKLTDEEARYIRANPHGVSQAELARRFGISEASVSTLISVKHWKYLSHGEAAGCCLPAPEPNDRAVAPARLSAPKSRSSKPALAAAKPETTHA